MKLCDVNNLLIFLVLIILANIAYNIFTNKKNVETFTNGWSLNNQGQLCNNGNCQSIGVLGTGDSGKICTVGSDTLNCNDITTTSTDDTSSSDVVGCMDSGAIDYNPDATLPGSCTQPSGGNVIVSNDSYFEFNNDTKELITNTDEIKGFELIYDPPGNGFPSLQVSSELFMNTGMMVGITTQGWNKIPSKDIISPSIIATIDETISMSMMLTIKDNNDVFNKYILNVSNGQVTSITSA